MSKVAVIGLGKLGCPVALSIAKRHDTVGYDVSPHAKEILRTRVYPHREARAQEYLETTSLRVVDTIAEAVAHADYILVAVQTPHQPEYEGTTRMPETRADFDYGMLRLAVGAVAREAEAQKKKVVVDVISTVLPGTVDREVKPLLNAYTGLVYSPYFIAMGTTIPDFENPEFVLLGVDDRDAADAAREFYGTITRARVVEMSVASAELTKVSYNVYLGVKIIVANAVMEIAHKTGANCDDVTNALALATDRVVSPKYMRGGGGDSGGCLTRGERVHTDDGTLPINKIERGDRVLGGDGEYHEVLETYRRPYKGQVITIVLQNGSQVTVTPEHPVHVTKRPGGNVFELPAGELVKGYSTVRRTDGHGEVLITDVCKTGLYEGTVYNLNVADVHNYVSVGGLVANCHPRDAIALSWLAQKLDMSFDIFGAMIKAREAQTEWLAQLATGFAIAHDMDVVVLGKAYKKGTNLTVGSYATLLVNILAEKMNVLATGTPIKGVDQWDPHVDGGTTWKGLEPACFIVATDHDEFYHADFRASIPKGSTIVDPWGKMSDLEGVDVVRVGRA